ncbi:MAG: DJ-1/PfpI family protein [Candidatus Peregrinibacteria bacterium]|nr:DJ-1/PfpI family protein [Candidatus Peregrinibacteria bacterium]
MKKALLIIAQQSYQDHELAGTRNGLVEGGFSVELASTNSGECVGKLGGTEKATVALKDVRVPEYDRIAFIGGPGAAALASDSEALRIAREAAALEMPLGAICIAPTILAAAGVLQGKRATVHNKDGKQGEFLEKHGADFTDEAVSLDGRIVTGNGPEAAEEFGRVLAAL